MYSFTFAQLCGHASMRHFLTYFLLSLDILVLSAQLKEAGSFTPTQTEIICELYSAIDSDDLEAVQELCPHIDDINGYAEIPDYASIGCTFLLKAVFKENVDIAHHLIEWGASASKPSKDGCHTPLSLAVECENFEMMRMLLAEDANVDYKSPKGNTLLHLAARRGTPECVAYLLATGMKNDEKDVFGRTPFHVAAFYGREDAILQLLAEYGANINNTDRHGNTPLHSAVRKGHLHVVKALIEMGARIDVKNESYMTPYRVAITEGKHDIETYIGAVCGNLIKKDIYGRISLHHAAQSGKANIVEFRLNNGANINAQDYSLRTPLHLAAESNNTSAVKLLIERGAQINAKDREGCTPLVLAIRNNSIDAALMLLAHTNNINETDDMGWTLLHHAAKRSESPEIVSMLLSMNCRFNSKNRNGETPLDLAKSGSAVHALIMEKCQQHSLRYRASKLFERFK